MASVKDMTRWGINIKTCRTISPEDFEAQVRNGCQPLQGDVLIAKDGATCLDTVCEYRQAEKIVLLSSVAILRPSKLIRSGYLRYYLDCAATRSMLKDGYVSGSAIPRVVLKDFRRAPIPIPPIEVQDNIAGILGALDDKIELNRKMNETLEQMAKALFKSWFVDFDPVHAKAAGRQPTGMDKATADLFPAHFVYSTDGMLPVGWRDATIKEVSEINGWSLGQSDNLESLEYVEISEVNRGDISNITTYPRGEEPSRARRRMRHGDTALSTVRPDRGSYFLALNPPENRIVSTGFAVLTPTKVPWSFLHAALTRPEVSDHLGVLADGGAYPAVRPEIIGAMKVALPNDSKVLESFHRFCAPLFEQAEANRIESRTLATLRDTLLPKLLSGELSASNFNPNEVVVT